MAEKNRKSPQRRSRSRATKGNNTGSKSVENKNNKTSTKSITSTSSKNVNSVTKDATKSVTNVASSAKQSLSRVNKRLVFSLLGWTLLLVLSFIMIDYFVQYLNKGYSAGVVYGEGYTARISRNDMYERLEMQFGEKMTERLIEEEIVKRAARQKKVTVTEKEVDEIVEKAKAELGGEEAYFSALQAYSWTDEIFRQQTEYEILKKKLLVEDPKDEDLQAFFDQYKQVYYSEDATYEDTDKEQLTELYKNQKLSELFDDWYQEQLTKVTVNNNYNEETDTSYGVLKTTRDILSTLWSEIRSEG